MDYGLYYSTYLVRVFIGEIFYSEAIYSVAGRLFEKRENYKCNSGEAIKSHTRTVVRECYKGDGKAYMEKPKI